MSTGALVLIWVWVISFIITQIEFRPRKGKGSTPLWDKDYRTIPPKIMICTAWLIFSGIFAPLALLVIIFVEIRCLWLYVVERDTKIKAKELKQNIFQEEINTLQQIRDSVSQEASLHREMIERATTETIEDTEELISPRLEEIYQKINNETPDYSPPKKDSEIKNRFEIMDLDK
jgi:hypothetical protein